MTQLYKTSIFAMLSVLLFVSCSTIGASEKNIEGIEIATSKEDGVKKRNTKIENIAGSKEKTKTIDEIDINDKNEETSSLENPEKEMDITEQRMTKNGDVFYRVLGVSYYSSNPYAEGIYIARSLHDAIAIGEGDEKYDTLFEKVDFTKEVLVFVFAGQYRTGGYSIEVDSIKRDGNGKILAQFSIIAPSMGDIVTQAITSPSMIIAIEAKKGELIKANIK